MLVSILRMYGKPAALVFGLMWLAMPLLAAPKTKRVTVTYEYHAGHVSPVQAKQVALERAQLQAIADEFGTIISNTTTTQVENSDVRLVSLGTSDVRGEWVRTIGEPKYTTTYDDEFGFVVTCTVTGEIRERVSADVDLRILTLRNGTTDKHQDDSFFSDDDLYLLFQSPVDGYVAVYLTDSENAYCLLPYQNQKESAMPIAKNEEYVFFSVASAPQTLRPIVDEYHLTCGDAVELNRIYVIFSPQAFTKAVDASGNDILPRNLSFRKFQEWLGKCRSHDEQMTCKAIDISIQPKR